MVVGHHHECLRQLILTPAYVMVCHYYILRILLRPFPLETIASDPHQSLIHLALAYPALAKVRSVIFLRDFPGMPGLREDHRLQRSLLPLARRSDEFGSILKHHGVDVVHNRDMISVLCRGV